MTARLRPFDWAPASVVAALCVTVGVIAGIDPAFAVIAALGVAFIVLTFADLAIGVVILIVVVFAETTPLAGPALSFTKLTGLLLAMAWVARLATRAAGTERLIFAAHPGFSYVLALFLGWVLVSVSWAADTQAALLQGSRLLLVAVLYVILYTAVRGRKQAIWVIAGFLTGAAGLAAYGLVSPPELGAADTGRLTVGDPNFLAATLVAGVAFAVAGFVAARGLPLLRLATAGATGLCLIAFFLTGSRGGLVAFGVALVAAVVVAGRWRAKAVVAVVVLAACTVGYLTTYAPPEVRERIASASQGEVEREEGRFTIWAVGWRMFEDNPIEGVGTGNFPQESIHYVLEPGSVFRTDRVIDQPPVAHNTYLGTLAELGIVGALLYLGILTFSIWCALVAARTFANRRDWRMEVLARGLVVAQSGVLAANFFISAETSKVTWLLLALGPALLSVARSAPRAPALDQRADETASARSPAASAV